MSTPRQFEVCAVGDGLAIFWSQINSAGFGLEPRYQVVQGTPARATRYPLLKPVGCSIAP